MPSVVVTGQKNPSKWFRAESQHFIVVSDTSNEEVTDLLNKLDYLLRIYTKDNDIARGSAQQVTPHYHDHVGGFNDMMRDKPAKAIGLYNSCSAGVKALACGSTAPSA